MTVYYNDNDPKACDWLEELIRRGNLPAGVVDRRSILDVRADDLRGFTQCHFFCGIGGWPLAFLIARIPEHTRIWTGSAPCQPFSQAGRQKGKDDERHLAPHFAGLVSAGRPDFVFGEQVASADVFGRAAGPAKRGAADAPEWAWVDDLLARLEAAHYAGVATDLPSSCIGAPHIRQRCFWGAKRLADADDAGPQGRGLLGGERAPERLVGASGVAGRMADMHGDGRGARGEGRPSLGYREAVGADRGAGRLADAAGSGWRPERQNLDAANGDSQICTGEAQFGRRGATCRPRSTDGFWRDADWLLCRDEKWRPVESGTFPLASRLPARMVRLRGYGNAINPWLAAEFVEAFFEAVAACDASGWRAERQIETLFDWAAE